MNNNMNWINVKDSLPDKYKQILFTEGETIMMGVFGSISSKDKDNGFICELHFDECYGHEYERGITHWMYSPELPNKRL